MPVFEGARGESFCFQRLELGGFFCAGQPGLAGWFNIYLLSFFLLPLLPFTYLTLPTCTLDPCFYCFSLQRRPIDKAKSTLFFLGNFAFMYFPSLITYTR